MGQSRYKNYRGSWSQELQLGDHYDFLPQNVKHIVIVQTFLFLNWTFPSTILDGSQTYKIYKGEMILRMGNLDSIFSISLPQSCLPLSLQFWFTKIYLHRTLYSLKATEIKESSLKLRLKGKRTPQVAISIFKFSSLHQNSITWG